MDMQALMRIGPVIPVLVIEDADDAVPLARALVDGGLRVLEVTLRTRAAMDAIRRIANAVPQAVVGVGTLTAADEFPAAIDAGARFGVSPGLTAPMIEAARRTGLPLLPGVMTPSEVIAARAAGYRALKLFPAQQAGGLGMLKAMSGPFADVMFCPTGGVSEDTAPQYLALPNVGCVGGSWVTPASALQTRDWAAITALAARAAALRPAPA